MMTKKNSLFLTSSVIVLIFGMTATILYSMGRVISCTCGKITFWQGNIWSSENSQQLSDWYTFSHLIHGFLLYWFFSGVAKKWKVETRLIITLLIEASWEILENSPIIINRYRAQTASLDYFGDSVINSLSDIFACLVGFWLAGRLPVWASVVVVILMELIVGYVIRDNLTLNIVMLIHPIQAIKDWQLQLAPHP